LSRVSNYMLTEPQVFGVNRRTSDWIGVLC